MSAPVAFDPDILAAAMVPATGNPAGVRMRRRDVFTRDPDVGAPVPAVISGVPYPIAMLWRRRRHYLARPGWRANGDVDLGPGVGGTDTQEQRAGCGEELLLHESFSLELLPNWTQISAGKL
jgi:hypothetical protein